MFQKLRLGLRRPSSATVIAFLALVFAIGGYAVAVPPQDKKEEVVLTTVTSGPFETEAGESDPVALPSFTQRAGEAVLIAVTADRDYLGQETDVCGVTVELFASSGSELAIVSGIEAHTQKGPDPSTAATALPAPATDTVRTLEAQVRENGANEEFDGCTDQAGEPVDAHWTVSLTVTITRLR